MTSLKTIATAASATVSGVIILAGVGAVASGLLAGGYHTVDAVPDATTTFKSGITDGAVAADIAASAVPLLVPACLTCKRGREDQALYAGHADKGVIIGFRSAGSVCFALDRAVTYATGNKLSDGASVCYTGAAGERIVTRPRWNLLIQTEHGQKHTGICSAPVTIGPDRLYAPCDADNDCADYVNGATCTARASVTADQIANVGVYVVHSNSGAAQAIATIEKVLFK